MDDDEDNDERYQEGDDDNDEDRSVRSYSKKRYFGKTTRDLKYFSTKTYLRFQKTYLKVPYLSIQPLKTTIQNNISKRGGPLSTSIKLKYKTDVGPLTNSSKFNVNLKNKLAIEKWDFSSSFTKKILQNNVGVSFKLNSKSQFICKLTQSKKFWEFWKEKLWVQGEWKKNANFGYGVSIQRKNMWNPTWTKMITQLNYLMGINLSRKSSGKKKIETTCKGHITSSENHKFYLQHKLSSQIQGQTPITNSFTASFQDSLGIGTLNGHLSFEKNILKTKQFRFVIEYNKNIAFGVQKRNEVFELMIRKTKIGYKWLKQFQCSVGNKGFLGTFQGKINLWKLPIDYTFNYKLKQIQDNFYDDSSLGYSFKFNL